MPKIFTVCSGAYFYSSFSAADPLRLAIAVVTGEAARALLDLLQAPARVANPAQCGVEKGLIAQGLRAHIRSINVFVWR